MRAFLAVIMAALLALVVVACVLALEPARWCVVHMRPLGRGRTGL